MKVAWLILLISAATDFVINAGTSLMAAMMATGSATIPTRAVLALSLIGGLVQMSRTIQGALKAAQGDGATLLGSKS